MHDPARASTIGSMTPTRLDPVTSTPRYALLAIAVALLLAVGILYSAAGLVAPIWAAALLWASWFGWAWVLVRLWQRRPVLALLTPPAALGFFLGAITAGEQLLGWTA